MHRRPKLIIKICFVYVINHVSLINVFRISRICYLLSNIEVTNDQIFLNINQDNEGLTVTAYYCLVQSVNQQNKDYQPTVRMNSKCTHAHLYSGNMKNCCKKDLYQSDNKVHGCISKGG